ncbi:MAG: flavin reductase family protein [Halobacteriaceae archaeon]
MTVDSDTFRRVMGNFATGVTVLVQPTDPPHGMTANAFSSVSLDPPLCLVCVDHDTDCYEHFESGHTEFAFTFLAADQQDLGEHFAGMTELEPSPFEARATTTAATGTPIFADGLAYADCTLEAAHPAGDHTIYVGAVEDAAVLDPDADALTFFQGEWGSLGDA